MGWEFLQPLLLLLSVRRAQKHLGLPDDLLLLPTPTSRPLVFSPGFAGRFDPYYTS